MPLYQFVNKKTDETWEEMMSISSMQEKVKDPDIELVICSPAIVSGVGGKPDSGFRDVLKQIKKNNIHSGINTF